MPCLFVSHGAGPLPLLKDGEHRALVDCIQFIGKQIKKPKAVLVISAHWEEQQATISSSAEPDLIYDYSGFSPAAYNIQYKCAGSPELAEDLAAQLQQAGIECRLDAQRGLDHGVFVPMKLLYPKADVPCVSLSLLSSLDAKQHIELGKQLAQLSDDNILIIGSGFSFHNLDAFFQKDRREVQIKNQAFESWLVSLCSNEKISENEREHMLTHWQYAPYATYCHPRAEHLLPLHVCYGATQRVCDEYFTVGLYDLQVSMFYWH